MVGGGTGAAGCGGAAACVDGGTGGIGAGVRCRLVGLVPVSCFGARERVALASLRCRAARGRRLPPRCCGWLDPPAALDLRAAPDAAASAQTHSGAAAIMMIAALSARRSGARAELNALRAANGRIDFTPDVDRWCARGPRSGRSRRGRMAEIRRGATRVATRSRRPSGRATRPRAARASAATPPPRSQSAGCARCPRPRARSAAPDDRHLRPDAIRPSARLLRRRSSNAGHDDVRLTSRRALGPPSVFPRRLNATRSQACWRERHEMATLLRAE